MNRDQLIEVLKEHKPVLAKRFGVVELALFGSAARDRAEDDSDVDILVGFDGPATLNSSEREQPIFQLKCARHIRRFLGAKYSQCATKSRTRTWGWMS